MITHNTNPCGSINRDKTGEKFIKRGVTVDFDGLRLRVCRVRLGTVYAETIYMRRPVVAACSQLRVVSP